MTTETDESGRGWTLSEADAKAIEARVGGRGMPPKNVLNAREKGCLDRHRTYICTDCWKLWGLAIVSVILMVPILAFVVIGAHREHQRVVTLRRS